MEEDRQSIRAFIRQRLTERVRDISPEWRTRLGWATPFSLFGLGFYVYLLSGVSGPGAEQIPQTLWGQQLVVAKNTFERKCSLCHSLDQVKAKIRWTPSMWYDVVDDMARRSNGAIGESSAKLIKQYVAQTFASKSWATFRRTREFPKADLSDPRQVFEARCSQCHVLSIIENKKYSLQEWHDVVYRMKNKWRSFITNDEAQVVEMYLTKKYLLPIAGGGAAASEAGASAKAAPEGAEFLKKSCAGCHPLDRIETAAKRPGRLPWKDIVQRMVTNGAPLSPAQVREITAYLQATYPSAAEAGASGGATASSKAEATGKTGGGPDVSAGKNLLQQKCTTCHGADKVEAAAKKAHPPWKTIVERMKSNGAQLTPEEISKITAYLDATYPSR